MFKNTKRAISLTVVLLLAMPMFMGMSSLKERKIIIFKSSVSVEEQDSLVKSHGGQKIKDLDLINGQSVLLTDREARLISKAADVLIVEDDHIVNAQVKPVKTVPAQTIPWGIERIEAEACWSVTKADPIRVGVIDTGIDLAHPDLALNIKGGISCVAYTKSYKDDNGHGTHVAGIIGALNNTLGVVGVGPEIDLYAVKVLNKQGSGYISDIVEGLEWCIENNMQVINMSLGSSYFSQALADAVDAVNSKGIVQVAAAGNSGGAIIYPAALPGVIAVGATDVNNAKAYFSCYGEALDLMAPGVSIYSTYKGSTYATLSGTSMASPHVAGAAALILAVHTGYDPADVEKALEDHAVDLGADGFDVYTGNGLVNAFDAIQ